MFDALAIGNNDVVKSQFERLNEKISGLKVFVYDFNGKVSFTTETKYQGDDITKIVGDKASLGIKMLLNSELTNRYDNDDKVSETYHLQFEGEPYTVSHKSIGNESRCFHCHGSSRNILGGITVCSSEALSLENIKNAKNKNFIIGAFGLILTIIIIWTLFHYLVNIKIAVITNISDSMSKGDFSNKIEVTGNNEISRILYGSKKMNNELRQMIQSVIKSCNQLVESSVILENISLVTLNHAASTSEKSARVAVSAEEMSANLSAIASAMEETSSNVNIIASASEQMHSTANEISKSTGKAKQTIDKTADAFKQTADVVNELGKSAQAIDEVTDNIREISEQVSLLALNAKIEAARAGFAGKGFAVVAEEIAELAVATANATLNVDEKLRWMKDKAEQTVSNIQGIVKTVEASEEAINTIASAVEEQAITTQEIANNISQMSQGIFEVNSTVTQGAITAKNVASDIAVIDGAASQINLSSHTLNEKSIHLEEMAANLMSIMKRFKV